jgi:hypothetical protein
LVCHIKGKTFENRALRGIFSSERGEVADGLVELHNEELRNFHSPTIITIKSRNMRYVRHVARMG